MHAGTILVVGSSPDLSGTYASPIPHAAFPGEGSITIINAGIERAASDLAQVHSCYDVSKPDLMIIDMDLFETVEQSLALASGIRAKKHDQKLVLVTCRKHWAAQAGRCGLIVLERPLHSMNIHRNLAKALDTPTVGIVFPLNPDMLA